MAARSLEDLLAAQLGGLTLEVIKAEAKAEQLAEENKILKQQIYELGKNNANVRIPDSPAGSMTKEEVK